MSDPYEETVDGLKVLRFAPGPRHEVICGRLHTHVARCLATMGATRLLAPRTAVQVDATSTMRPDLALVATDTGKLWLAAEVISSDDHRADTVSKKLVYEDLNLPRLWMVDPRYHNVEVYHGSPYGLTLKHILAGREALSDPVMPELRIVIDELFEA